MQFGNRKEVWEAIRPHMGYMAMLRNLRNFINAGVAMGPVLERLSDPEQVRRSKQLPFRFYTAWRDAEDSDCRERRPRRPDAGRAHGSDRELSGEPAADERAHGDRRRPLGVDGAAGSKQSTVTLRQISSLDGRFGRAHL